MIYLDIGNATVLLGSYNYGDYTTGTHKNMCKNKPYMDRCFIFAKNSKSIVIEGYGIIYGNGYRTNFKKERPILVRFVNYDISLINLAAWTSACLYCNNVSVSNI